MLARPEEFTESVTDGDISMSRIESSRDHLLLELPTDDGTLRVALVGEEISAFLKATEPLSDAAAERITSELLGKDEVQ
jgi:hypothetical protein